MKRVYLRHQDRSYKHIGFICDQGHIVLDDAPPTGETHLVTPTYPPRVICTLNGETVDPHAA